MKLSRPSRRGGLTVLSTAAFAQEEEGPQHLQLVGLHRRGHVIKNFERNRHQGPVRQLRQQRDPPRQAGGRQDRLRHRGALVQLGQRLQIDGGLLRKLDKNNQIPELEEPGPGRCRALAVMDPATNSGELAVGLHHGGHQRRQGQRPPWGDADAGKRLGPGLQAEYVSKLKAAA